MTKDSVQVGLVGLGFIGKIHAHAYQAIPYCFGNGQVQANLRALLRTHVGSDAELLRSLGSPFETAQPQEFIDQDLDMVDVCSPNYLHPQHVMLALEKGKHVYCEKPLAANLTQARALAQAAEKAGVLTHSAFTMRYYPAAQQAKSILASGILGEIYNFRAYLFHNSYMDPQRPTSWRLQKDISGGGALTDLGVHNIDMVRYLLGDAKWVQCRTRTFITQRPKSAGSTEMVPVDVDDWALCMLEMENGARGSVETTRMSGGITDTSRIQIFGSEGSLEINFLNPLQVSLYDRKHAQTTVGPTDFPLADGQRPLKNIYPPAKLSMGTFIDTHFASIMDFLHCIQENKPSPAGFSESLKVQEILEAAYLSADRNGETIALPLV
jgi:predicted dehydrogenase